MARRIALSALIALFAASAGVASAGDPCPPDLEREAGLLAEAAQVRREINLHNLYNGLHLTVEQMEKILVCAREAGALRDRCFGPGNERAVRAVEVYRQILERVRRGEKIPTSLEGLGGISEIDERRIRKQWFEGIEALEKRIWEVLTPAQREVFRTYNPCLIPPRNLKDPVRVGQAATNEEERQLLDTARRLPADSFESGVRALVETYLSFIEKLLGPIDAPEREKDIQRILAVCRRARALPDVEYELQAGALAEEVCLQRPIDRVREKAGEFEDLVRKFQGGAIGKVAKHFLDPAAIPILEERIARARNAPPAEPKDLGGLESPRKDGEPCGMKPGAEDPLRKKKYTTAELVEVLHLEGPARAGFLRVVQKAKAAQMKVLQTPMADGRTVFEKFLEIQKLPPEKREAAAQELFGKLQDPMPGRDTSFAEVLLRIKMEMDRQFKETLAPQQYEDLVTRVNDLLDDIEISDQKKPSVEEVAARLELSAPKAAALRDILKKGQGEAWGLLSTPDENGRRPIDAILAAQSAPPEKQQQAMAAFLEALGRKVPGKDRTYGEEIERIKGELDAALRKALDPAAYEKLRAMGVDVLDIQTGD